MHRLASDFILERFAAGEMRGEFPAASLFADISGFSNLTEALMARGQYGAEVLAKIMRAVYEPLLQSVYEQGGFVVSLAGDAFTALFPLDEPQAQGYQRALAAAWKIQERMAGVAEQAIAGGTFSLAVKVGVAAGDVDWGIVRSKDGSRAADYFRGAAIDGCATAEHCAGPGEIILAANFYDRVSGSVVVEQVPRAETHSDHYRLAAVTTPLPEGQPVHQPPVNLEIASRMYPSELITQPFSGEFRHVVNLFISLPTVRTEAQLAIFMQSLFALQDQYGGLLNRLDFGDKGSNLLLFWGAPAAHENDIERALDFILNLQTQTSIPINAGVTYQISHAGFIGSALREEYTCFGKGVNLAARFMTLASRGEIWLDEAMAQRAAYLYNVDFEGEMRFKGFSEPQRVYVLYERKEEPQEFTQGSLIGREDELRQLADFCAPLSQGHYAGVMLIQGEAGIGKSRLAQSFLADEATFAPNTRWVFHAQADEILRRAFDPFRSGLRRFFGQLRAQSESRNKRSFNNSLDRLIEITPDQSLADELDRTRSFLAAILDLHWPDSLFEQLDPQGRYENSFIGLLSLIQAESLLRPVIVLLEDAHWLDEASRVFLTRLVRALTADESKTYPVGLIITTRPTEVEILPVELVSRKIDLLPLADDSLALLAQDLLGGAASPDLLAMLAERSGGNPFFAEQILRYLKTSGLLAESEHGWRVVEGAVASLLPTDVRAVLVARLDQLAQDVKQVVQTASVLGSEFEVQLLARMLQEPHALPEKVARAEQAGIWALLSELRYIFNHALLRDAAYEMQVLAQRQSLHALALTAMENLYAQEGSPRYAELAYHAGQAGLPDKERLYLHQAGDAARDAFENNLAIDFYSRALALLGEGEMNTRCDLLLARESVWHLLGKRDEQRQDLEALASHAEKSGDAHLQAEVALRRARHAGATGEHRSAIAAAQEAVNLALQNGRDDLAAQGYREWGWYLMRQTAYDEAHARLQQALAFARKAGKAGLEAESLNGLGALANERDDLAAAARYYQQAGELYRRNHDRKGESTIYNNLGTVASTQGRYPEAISHFERALEIRRQIGNRRGEGNTLYNLGASCRAQHLYTRARACYERSLTIARQVGDRRGQGLVLNSLGLLAANLGEYERSCDSCEQSLAIFESIGDRMLVIVAQANLGSYALNLGDFEKARQRYQLALDVAREIGRPLFEVSALIGMGEATLGLGQPKEAVDYFEAALEKAPALDDPSLIIQSRSGLARAVLAQGDLVRAGMLVDQIIAALDSPSLDSTEEVYLIYLTCVQVLEAQSDPRAAAVLSQAHDRLQEQAARISDEAMRQAFLYNVADHRRLIEAYQGHQGK